MFAKLKLQHPKQILIYQIHNPGHTKRSWLPQSFFCAKTSWMTTDHYIDLIRTLAAPTPNLPLPTPCPLTKKLHQSSPPPSTVHDSLGGLASRRYWRGWGSWSRYSEPGVLRSFWVLGQGPQWGRHYSINLLNSYWPLGVISGNGGSLKSWLCIRWKCWTKSSILCYSLKDLYLHTAYLCGLIGPRSDSSHEILKGLAKQNNKVCMGCMSSSKINKQDQSARRVLSVTFKCSSILMYSMLLWSV